MMLMTTTTMMMLNTNLAQVTFEHEFGSSHFGSGNEGPGCKEGQWPWPRLEEWRPWSSCQLQPRKEWRRKQMGSKDAGPGRKIFWWWWWRRWWWSLLTTTRTEEKTAVWGSCAGCNFDQVSSIFDQFLSILAKIDQKLIAAGKSKKNWQKLIKSIFFN